MKIVLNGEAVEIESVSLSDALSELGYEESIIATAVNGCFVPVGKRAMESLSEGDRLEVLTPRQGG